MRPMHWLLLGTVACSSAGTTEVDDPDPNSPGNDNPDNSVASVTVTPSSVSLTVGDTVRLAATLKNQGGTVLTGPSVSWSSDDSGVASVASNGLVEAEAAGSAIVTAAAEGKSGTASITVSAPSLGLANECTQPSSEWIWCDDFETDRLGSYFEYDDAQGSFVRASGVGIDGSMGMRVQWDSAQVGAGALHLAMGRTPQTYFSPVDDGTQDYNSVYWRIYVKHQSGWQGGGAYKLSRAFIFASPDSWAQAMIAHVWAGAPPNEDILAIDPVSGTDSQGNVVTTKYNDFDNFQWLGLEWSSTPIFDAAHIGNWYCVEAHAALNSPGQSDGVFQLWIDDQLEAERTDLNWVDTFQEYGINAVYFENWWNTGSVQPQERYFDNIVVSTQPIGC